MESWIAFQDVLYAKPLIANALCARFGSPEAVWRGARRAMAATPEEWAAVQTFRAAADPGRAAETLRWCAANGVRIVRAVDPDYPPQLQPFPDRPPILYVDGDVTALRAAPIVAIVGSRKATAYGRAMAERLASELTAAGVTIASGLAVGIDGVAHRAALAARGRTIGVLGGGFRRFYPAVHRPLAAAMRERGAVVSEFPPLVAAHPAHFPQRNRIISGLSLAVIVVEAAAHSGTLSTARHAAEQGRAVFAVPGPANHLTTRGTHHLLREGAQLAECGQDILEVILPMWEGGGGLPCARQQEDAIGAALLPLLDEARVVDTLAAAADRPVGDVLAWLTQMTAAGRVRALPGNRFIRCEG